MFTCEKHLKALHVFLRGTFFFIFVFSVSVWASISNLQDGSMPFSSFECTWAVAWLLFHTVTSHANLILLPALAFGLPLEVFHLLLFYIQLDLVLQMLEQRFPRFQVIKYLRRFFILVLTHFAESCSAWIVAPVTFNGLQTVKFFEGNSFFKHQL